LKGATTSTDIATSYCNWAKIKTEPKPLWPGSFVNATLYAMGQIVADTTATGKYNLVVYYFRKLQYEEVNVTNRTSATLVFKNDSATAALRCDDFGSQEITLRRIVFSFVTGPSSAPATFVNLERSATNYSLYVTNLKFYPGAAPNTTYLTESSGQHLFEGDPLGRLR
jgi:hypothetical protein